MACKKKPYADHIYHWNLKVSYAKEEEILDFCKKYLKDAKREEQDYLKEYRNISNTFKFNELMEIVCGGYYKLSHNKETHTWDYIARFEYID